MHSVQRVLVSVSDKSGIIDFARGLTELGIALLSTGGTYRCLQEAGITAQEVSEYTNFPEIMGGRVKTLHPKIHGGILARRHNDGAKTTGIDVGTMAEHNITGIDMVVVNLYPFATTIAKPDTTLAEAIENIDIGGPTMLRAAAKNYASVAVLTKPTDYAAVLDELQQHQGALCTATRFDLAAKAFQHTAGYDGAVANYLGSFVGDQQELPGRYLNLAFERTQVLRYGENPHQSAALYSTKPAAGIGAAKQLQGKALSYNNINDTESAWQCVCSFDKPACVIVKHANPCGVAVAKDLYQAYEHAYATDPTSAFGGILAFNCHLESGLLSLIAGRQYSEVIIAPSVDDDATSALKKHKNIRLLVLPLMPPQPYFEYRTIAGGLLAQEADTINLPADLAVVTQKQPNPAQQRDLLFAWQVAKFVKSNAMVLAADGHTIGIGAGQTSRVDSSRIAIWKAYEQGLKTQGAVLASDAFLPFRDGLDVAAETGIAALIQPGGSMRDNEVIAAANEAGIAMLFTRQRHFRH